MSQEKILLSKIVRVNQAGEYGARRIYQGMLDWSTENEFRNDIQHMKDQEEIHYRYFNQKMIEEGVNPTLFHPIWHIGGYLMGAITTVLDPKLAHACTIAVEEVICDHYTQHLDEIDHLPSPHSLSGLKEAIIQFRSEEEEHKHIAQQKGGDAHPAHHIVKNVVKTVTKAAIFLSHKL